MAGVIGAMEGNKGEKCKNYGGKGKKLNKILEFREHFESWERKMLDWKNRLKGLSSVDKKGMEEEWERIMKEWKKLEGEWRKEHLEITLILLEERWESLGGGMAKLGELAEVDLEEEFE